MVGSEWIGRTIGGRYEVHGVIGVGGMGTVLRARHRYTHADVAVKVMHADLAFDASSLARFLAEARAPAAIGHPAIVEIIDADVLAGGELYIVMELLGGPSLRQAIAAGLPTEQVRRIGLELLDALGAAHRRGFVHRDLKPENVLLVPPARTVKLLDFGIAKVLGSASGTQRGRMLGTLEYMAPEQLADASAVDGRADLWAVGVILYEAIAGVRPLGGSTRAQKFAALAADEPIPIEELAPVSPDAAAFFARALARDPANRFASAEAMAAHLRPLAIERTASPGSGSAAGPTLASGPRPVPAAAPHVAPHAAPSPPAADRHADPGARGQRRWPILVGLAALAIAIAVVAIISASRSGDPVAQPPVDATVARTDAPAVLSAERCEAACTKLAGCQLAQRGCREDCEHRRTPLACIEAAEGCDAIATCILASVCPDLPQLPTNGTSCVDALGCELRCPTGGTCVCNCLRRLRSSAAAPFTRLYLCRLETLGEPAAFERQCTPLVKPCALSR